MYSYLVVTVCCLGTCTVTLLLQFVLWEHVQLLCCYSLLFGNMYSYFVVWEHLQLLCCLGTCTVTLLLQFVVWEHVQLLSCYSLLFRNMYSYFVVTVCCLGTCTVTLLFGNIYSYFVVTVCCLGTCTVTLLLQFVVWEHVQLLCTEREHRYHRLRENQTLHWTVWGCSPGGPLFPDTEETCLYRHGKPGQSVTKVTYTDTKNHGNAFLL
jgi:hypothetical protein